MSASAMKYPKFTVRQKAEDEIHHDAPVKAKSILAAGRDAINGVPNWSEPCGHSSGPP